MGGQSKTELNIDFLKEYLRISESDKIYPFFKKLLEILLLQSQPGGEVSEEEIQNHYNVNVYKVLPYPPDKKESLTKWLDFF